MIRKELNQALNGIELYFDGKPEEATREALKAAGYRWNREKKCWYAKQTEEALKAADDLNAKEGTATAKTETAEAIDLEGLQDLPCLYGTELTAAIRADLKKRGVKGVTVRGRRGSGITVTVKASADDIASVEEMKLRYTFSYFLCKAESHGFFNGERWIYNISELDEATKKAEYDKTVRGYLARVNDFSIYHHERKDCPELTTAFYNKLVAVYKIANQWNYDNSDRMSDYYDVGYYLHIDIKKPDFFIPRENMTEEERASYAAELKAEEEAHKAWEAEYERQQEEDRKRREKYEAKRKEDRAIIENNISVVDLDTAAQIYITNLAGGIGKECNLEELEETLKDRTERSDAIITRKVIFTEEAAYNAFCNYFLDDFNFLNGKGGTGSSDIRLEGLRLYDLNASQRESVKFYLCDCVGVYVGEELRLAVDPEGFSYARYVFKPTDASQILNAEEEDRKQILESENKRPFYFPADVTKQAEYLKAGEAVTVYQSDGWNLCSVNGGAGIVESVEAGSYAQYKGVYITLKNGKKASRVFIRNGKKTLIYRGIKPALPESITRRQISNNMYELLQADEMLEGILNYYEDAPLVDTIQR